MLRIILINFVLFAFSTSLANCEADRKSISWSVEFPSSSTNSNKYQEHSKSATTENLAKNEENLKSFPTIHPTDWSLLKDSSGADNQINFGLNNQTVAWPKNMFDNLIQPQNALLMDHFVGTKNNLISDMSIKRPDQSAFINTLFNLPSSEQTLKKHWLMPYTNGGNKNLWTKPVSSRRRSYDSASDNQDKHKVKFDDGNELDLPKNTKDYLASYATLPLVYESPVVSRSSASLSENENLNSIVDNLLSGSRYSAVANNPIPAYYAYPTYSAHRIPMTARKAGLEKSIGYPILIGIGAALISFLIISNLFLSIPLFAMTLMQFLNGNGIMPNNNNNQSPNNQGQTTVNGRKRRDLQNIELEQKIIEAIEGRTLKY